MKYYTINTTSKWGDAGSLLIAGIGFREFRHSALLLQRTGPFVPAMSEHSGLLVVTPNTSDELKRRWGEELVQRQVILEKVVLSSWDGTLDDGEEISWEHEPESIILDEPHSSDIANQIRGISAFEPVASVRILDFDVDYNENPSLVRYHGGVINGSICEILYPGGFGICCDDTFKEWILQNPSHSRWLEFSPMIRLSGRVARP